MYPKHKFSHCHHLQQLFHSSRFLYSIAPETAFVRGEERRKETLNKTQDHNPGPTEEQSLSLRESAHQLSMGDHPREKRGPGELVDVQKPSLPGSRTVHPNTEEIKKKLQEAWKHEQIALD